MPGAARGLGRAYYVSGEVRLGRQKGAALGFPTANLVPGEEKLLPPDGVYVTETGFPGGSQGFRGVTNVGTNPTFGGVARTVETHLIDFKDMIYGRQIQVDFLARLRGETLFPSEAALAEGIRRDCRQARDYSAGVI
jgi:riboflavin kinase/FMN adenylyltransferase